MDIHPRIATICLYLTAAISVIALLALALLYISFAVPLGSFPYGITNDLLTAVHYAMLVPITLFVHNRVKHVDEQRARTALWIALVGIVLIVMFQVMLLTGVLKFEIQILMVIPPFFFVLYWYVVVGTLGRRSSTFATSRTLDVLTGLYIGYPVWALRIAKSIQSSDNQQ
jgi:hypothetical protein